MHIINRKFVMLVFLFWSLVFWHGVSFAQGGHKSDLGKVKIDGAISGAQDLSAVVCTSKGTCLLGSDKSNTVTSIKKDGDKYKVVQQINLSDGSQKVDIEAATVWGSSYYIIGSHGNSEKTYEEQWSSFDFYQLQMDLVTGKTRYPLDIDSKMPIKGMVKMSLANLLARDVELGRYFEQCLQENGINIEGLTVNRGAFYVGFRAPNIKNRVPVLEVAVGEIFRSEVKGALPGGLQINDAHRVHWIDLGAGNLGIRGLVALKRGFVLMVGSSKPKDKATFQLRYWDGIHSNTTLMVEDLKKHMANKDLQEAELAQPEGIALISETDETIDLMIVCDGIQRGGVRVIRVNKSKSEEESTLSGAFSAWRERYLPDYEEFIRKLGN
ncbi:MAG: DUF3616 domain-containing protein [Bacteriovoracaceae bacterium]|nr:DUF3616 domain-containing protein [Bacteriovoracaceae bacterium]